MLTDRVRCAYTASILVLLVSGVSESSIPAALRIEGEDDSQRSRVTSISSTGLGQLAAYVHAGVSQRVAQAFGCGVSQSFATQDGYGGLDRFGRVRDLHYLHSGQMVHRYQYGYDLAGNRIFADVQRWAAPPGEQRSYEYVYDELQRLVEARLGELDAAGQVPEPLRDTTWRLDNLGNFSGGGGGVPAGLLLEQYVYDPYGRVLAVETFDCEGNPVDPETGYDPNNPDPNEPLAGWLPRGSVGHQGLFFLRLDGLNTQPLLRPSARGFYHNRNRAYEAVLGRRRGLGAERSTAGNDADRANTLHTIVAYSGQSVLRSSRTASNE